MLQDIFENDIERRTSFTEMRELLATHATLAAQDGFAPLEPLLDLVKPAFGASLSVLSPLEGGEFIYIYYGSNLAALAGRNMSGRVTSDFNDQVGTFLGQLYRRVLETGRPLLSVHSASRSTQAFVWERLVVPCRSADGQNRIMALSKPRALQSDLLKAVLNASSDVIFACRPLRDSGGEIVDAEIIMANRAMMLLTRRRMDELINGRLLELFPGLVEAGAWGEYVSVMRTGRRRAFEMHYDHAGITGWYKVTVSAVEDGIVVSATDVSELKAALAAAEGALRDAERAQEELRLLSRTDTLTGVLNRRGFEEAVRHHSTALRRYRYEMSVIAVDVDHFKRINDTFGHATGDSVLILVASILRSETRLDVDVVGRSGGEEFLILLPHTGLDGAVTVAERMRQRLLDSPLVLDGQTLIITASFGVGEFDPGVEPERTLLQADGALYRAKQAGRNRVAIAGSADEAPSGRQHASGEIA